MKIKFYQEIDATVAKDNQRKIRNEVASGNRIVVNFHGRPVYAAISIPELRLLEALGEMVNFNYVLDVLKNGGDISLKDILDREIKDNTNQLEKPAPEALAGKDFYEVIKSTS